MWNSVSTVAVSLVVLMSLLNVVVVSGGDLLAEQIQTAEVESEMTRTTPYPTAPPVWSMIKSTPVVNFDDLEAPPPDNFAIITSVEEGGRELEDTSASQYGVQCIQEEACQYYNDVLLVVKLNPVRLLWLDALLNFYGTAFKHIVFYSALRKDDTSQHKWLRIGGRRVFVRLLDDNYGFCDHATIADASARHKNKKFSGFLYLSDDVLMMFWKFIGHDKLNLWKQKPSVNPKSDTIDGGTRKAIQELNTRHGYSLSTKDFLFAQTSGCYFVPNNEKLLERFSFISNILLKHRSYNEWGTPLLLSAIMTDTPKFDAFPKKEKVEVTIVRGKLVWGHKRILVKKMFNFAYSWYHPIRANGEAFQRLNLYLHDPDHNQLNAASDISMTKLFESSYCLNCATYPKADRVMKGLLHGCVLANSATVRAGKCGPTTAVWPGYKDAGLIGGQVVVPSSRQNQLSPLELKHEGFWNKNLTLFMYETHYDRMNATKHSGLMLNGFPKCCHEP